MTKGAGGGSGSGAGREVVIRLRLASDSGPNKAAADATVREANKIQKQILTAAERANKEKEKLEKAAQTAKERADKEKERKEDRMHHRQRERTHARAMANRKALEQEARDKAKADKEKEREEDRIHHRHRERQRSIALQNRKARDEEAKAASQAAKEIETNQMKAAKAAARAAKEAETAQVKAANATLAAQMKLGASAVGVARGIAQVARGSILLWVSNEEELEKALRLYAKVEAGIQILGGTFQIIKTGVEAWRAYTAAVKAATTAQAALAAVEAVSGVAGAAGAAKAAGKGGFARFAGGAIASGAGYLGRAAGGLAVAGAGMAKGAAIPLAGGLLLGEGLSRAATGGREGTVSAAFSAWNARTAAQASTRRTEAMQSNRVNMLNSMEQREQARAFNINQAVSQYAGPSLDEAGTFARRGKKGATADVADISARIAASRNARASIENSAGIVGKSGEEAERFRLGMIQEELSLQQELRDAKMREHQELLGEIDERISKTRTAKQAAEDLFRTEQQRLLTAEQRLAALNPLEAAALKGAVGKLQAGQDVSRRELDLVRGVGLYDDKVQEQDRKRVSALGLDGLLAEQRGRVGAAAAETARLSLQLTSELTAKVKLENDGEELGQQLAEQLIPMLRAEREQVIKAAVEASQRESNRNAAARGAQTGAGG